MRKKVEEKRTGMKSAGAKKTEEKKEEFITELDQYLFGQGVHYEIYEKLGAHPCKQRGRNGVNFAVWAPHAKEVYLIGSFNDWDETACPMTRLEPLGIYEVFLTEARKGDLYKFLIHTQDGRKLYKADPFANTAEMRPGTASRVTDISKISWSDREWMEKRASYIPDTNPIAIYEVHPGSWKKHPHGEDEDGFYNYREFARSLTEYVKDMGYTHV